MSPSCRPSWPEISQVRGKPARIACPTSLPSLPGRFDLSDVRGADGVPDVVQQVIRIERRRRTETLDVLYPT